MNYKKGDIIYCPIANINYINTIGIIVARFNYSFYMEELWCPDKEIVHQYPLEYKYFYKGVTWELPDWEGNIKIANYFKLKNKEKILSMLCSEDINTRSFCMALLNNGTLK